MSKIFLFSFLLSRWQTANRRAIGAEDKQEEAPSPPLQTPLRLRLGESDVLCSTSPSMWTCCCNDRLSGPRQVSKLLCRADAFFQEHKTGRALDLDSHTLLILTPHPFSGVLGFFKGLHANKDPFQKLPLQMQCLFSSTASMVKIFER